MKKVMMILLLVLCMMSVIFAMEPLPRAVLSVDGRSDKVKLKLNRGPEGGTAYNPAWKTGRDFYIYSLSQQLKKDDWEEYKLSFTPGKDGYITIILKGVWYMPKGEKRPIPVWNCWDNIKIEGAEISNGEFEKLGKNGLPEDWNMKPVNFISSKENKYVKVCDSSSVWQKIKVKKDITVTISAKIKKT